jgi:hypothetical protein
MTSMTASVAAATAQSTASAAATAAAGPTPALGRDRAFTAFASAILGALGASSAGSSTPAGGGRVSAVALALENALEGSGGSSSTVGGLLSSVQNAIAQASQSLGQAGFSTSAIQHFATQFVAALSHRLDVLASQAANQDPSPAATAASAAPAVATVPAAAAPAAASAATGATAAAAAGPPATTTSTVNPTASAAAGAATAATITTTGGSSTTTSSGATTSGSGAFEASYQLSENGSVKLVTTDGAVVRIAFGTSRDGASTGASATAAAGIAAYLSASSYASGGFRISVQGSLSAADQQAVNAVLGQVGTLASQFFAGDFTQAFASAAALNIDPAEIAGVAVKLNESLSLDLASVAGGGAATPAASAAPAATAAAPASLNVAPAAAASSTSGTAAATSGAGDATGGGVTTLFDYLEKLLAELGTTTTGDTVSVAARAKLHLLAATISQSAVTADERAAASFLQGVVGATTDATTSPAAAAAAA